LSALNITPQPAKIVLLSRESTQTQANHSCIAVYTKPEVPIYNAISSQSRKLLDQGILYLGPTTSKKQFRDLWKYSNGKSIKKPTNKT